MPESWNGWTVVRSDKDAPKQARALLNRAHPGSAKVLLTKGDPDNGGRYVLVGGEEGIDPAIVLERAKLHALNDDIETATSGTDRQKAIKARDRYLATEVRPAMAARAAKAAALAAYDAEEE